VYQAFITAADSFGAQVKAKKDFREQIQALKTEVEDAGRIERARSQSKMDLIDRQHAEAKAEFETKEKALVKALVALT
jgi:hypothetical protein